MSVEVELFGGPADGKRIALVGDPMDPPLTVELQHLERPVRSWEHEPGSIESLPVRTLVYRRAPSPADEGPLWHYRYEAA